MQRLLVQSACEAFAAADISKSRSNSGASSINQSSISASFRSKSNVYSPITERVSALRRGLFQQRRSSSLCSISGGRGSPEMGRGKHCIKRSESIHLSRTMSPLLGKARFLLTFRGQLSPCGHPIITDTCYYGQNPLPRVLRSKLRGKS